MKLKKKLWQILWLVDFNVETFVILEHMQKMSFAGDYAEKKKLMWMWSSCSFLCFYAAMECIIRGNLIWFEVKGKDEKKVKNVGWCNENVAIANDWTCSSLVADPNSWNTMLSWGCQWLDDIKFYSSCAKNMSDHMELIPAWV